MKSAYITEAHPLDVAREVERQVASGRRSFVLRPVADGGMLDQERLGAARYAAGVHAEVALAAVSEALAR